MFSGNISNLTSKNNNYRKVVFTNKYQQLVIMSLNPGEDIPQETHDGSQFIRVEEGRGIAIISGEQKRIGPGSALIIGPGQKHYVKQTGPQSLKLYTIYSPPEHPPNAKLIRQK